MNILWFISTILIIAILFYLLLRKRKKDKIDLTEKDRIVSEILESKIDFQNIFKSSFEATSLYNQLKVLYHPDKFITAEKKEVATKLFQEITSNKYDYKKLIEIKQIAENELLTNK